MKFIHVAQRKHTQTSMKTFSERGQWSHQDSDFYLKKNKGLRNSLKTKTNSPQKGKVEGEVEEVTDFYQQRLVLFRPKLFPLHRNTEEIKQNERVVWFKKYSV